MKIEAPQLDRRSWALLIALAFLWSVSFVFIKVAVAEIPVLTLVLVRVGLAASVLHAVVLVTGRRYPREPAVLARYALMGLVNNILPFALIVYATARIGAGAASILNATAPIFALIVAHVATADEKITPAKLGGVLLGVGGVAAMVGPQALDRADRRDAGGRSHAACHLILRDCCRARPLRSAASTQPSRRPASSPHQASCCCR